MKSPAEASNTALLVVGASGFVGSAICREGLSRSFNVAGTYCRNAGNAKGMVRFDLGLDGAAAEMPSLLAEVPDKAAVICACISSIDLCAREKEETYKVNVTNTIALINVLIERGFKIVFISTDHVFDGKRGNYAETDEKRPINEYGRQKALVEDYIDGNIEGGLIVRLSKVCADYAHPKNLFTGWMHQVRRGETIYCIKDQCFSPTSDTDVAKGVCLLLERGCRGTFNLAGLPQRRSDLARLFAERLGKEREVEIVEKDVDSFGFADARPLKSYLNNTKVVQHTGIDFCAMQELIDDYVAKDT